MYLLGRVTQESGTQIIIQHKMLIVLRRENPSGVEGALESPVKGTQVESHVTWARNFAFLSLGLQRLKTGPMRSFGKEHIRWHVRNDPAQCPAHQRCPRCLGSLNHCYFLTAATSHPSLFTLWFYWEAKKRGTQPTLKPTLGQEFASSSFNNSDSYCVFYVWETQGWGRPQFLHFFF